MIFPSPELLPASPTLSFAPSFAELGLFSDHGDSGPSVRRISPGGKHILLLWLICCTLQAPLAMKPAVVTGGCCFPLGILWKMSLKTGWSPVQPFQSWWKWLLRIWTRRGELPLCPGRDRWEDPLRHDNPWKTQKPMLVNSESCSVVSDSVTPWTVARQAPLSVEFSRQEYWSG